MPLFAEDEQSKKPPRDEAWRLFWNCRRLFCETPLVFYGLFTTTFGAGLLVSSWALTFWICAACSLSWAVRVSICFCCNATVTCNPSTLRFSMACLSVRGTWGWRVGEKIHPYRLHRRRCSCPAFHRNRRGPNSCRRGGNRRTVDVADKAPVTYLAKNTVDTIMVADDDIVIGDGDTIPGVVTNSHVYC